MWMLIFFLYFCCLPLNKEVCLVQYFDWMTEEAESKKLKWLFPCKTEMDGSDFLWKKVIA